MKAELATYQEKNEVSAVINEAVAKAEIYVRKGYLSGLDDAGILPMEKELAGIVPGNNLRLIRLDSFVYEKEQSVAEKLKTVYGALRGRGISAVLFLEGKTDRVNLYLGVSADRYDRLSSGYRTFLNSFQGIFPGCRYENMKFEESRGMLKRILPEDEKITVAAISGFPEEKTDQRNVPGERLDVLIDGMRGRPFSMILLADCMDAGEIVRARKSLESLYTQISPFQKQEVSMSEGETESYGVSVSETISRSITLSTGISTGQTKTLGTSRSEQSVEEDEQAEKHEAALQTAGTLIAAGMGGWMQAGMGGLFYAPAVTNALKKADAWMGADAARRPKSVTETEQESTADSKTETRTESAADSEAKAEGYNLGRGTTLSRSTQRSCVNRSVSGLLDQIEREIRRLDRLEHEGAFRVAGYFIAGDTETAVSAANLYRSIVFSSGGMKESSGIYQWSEREQVEQIRRYLLRGAHPVFSFGEESGFPRIQAGQPVGLSDMPAYFCLPEKSLPGFHVSSHAAFARDILCGGPGAGDTEDRRARIGCVTHMGKEDPYTEVSFGLNGLTSHLFVSGATGVGKSNFCYQLLDQAVGQGVKALVIEPAKGEYARVFGGRDGFRVYGTNVRYAPPLRVNPFAYPDGIHVLEHIDRLMAIFQAAWPLYSAMPAILKDAVEEIYRDKGFDMMVGDCPEGGEFPGFADLLEKLPEVIGRSAYSGEVKGNYTGALVTRVKSLTNGIYGTVFGREEIGDRGLFDENVIVDISRVGSEETRALIMGVLVMRLTEHRMCSGEMNSPLRHLTLLEEAHHLLRRQTGPVSADTGNMKAASAEMITNAIAEMRTYGEGFVIADQSPSVMDQSAIRNTRTKVFFMLPDRDDRRIAGDSVALTEWQQQELAKLPAGTAVVYQSQWTEPVLCRVDYYGKEKARPFIYQRTDLRGDNRKYIGQCLAVLLKNRLADQSASTLDEELIRSLDGKMPLLDEKRARTARKVCSEYLKGTPVPVEVKKIAGDIEILLGFGGIFERCSGSAAIGEWAGKMEKEIQNQAEVSEPEAQTLVLIGIQSRIHKNREYRKLYVRYLAYCLEGRNRP